MKPNLLISACLVGELCRYDGGHNRTAHLDRLQQRYHLIPVCPEVLGGLPTPRVPAERQGGTVMTKDGHDVTQAFINGARKTLTIARDHACSAALLKAKSPSCGCGQIYDGTFTGTLQAGNGVTAELLLDEGITVFTELTINELLKNNRL